METLIVLSLGPTIYSDTVTTKDCGNPFKRENVHPVAKRYDPNANEKDVFNYCMFRYLKTTSEKYGEEQGYVANVMLDNMKLVELSIHEEAKAREEKLTPEIIKSLEAKTQKYEDSFWKAREKYKQSLLDLGYIEYIVSDYEIDTEVYMIHPLYIAQWKDDWIKNPDKYPSWAVKDIGYFPTRDK